MKNSKVLSLLTAGALVVSSFSGLVMNGGAALAAEQTSKDTTGIVTFADTIKYNTTQGYQTIAGETGTINYTPTTGNYAYYGVTDALLAVDMGATDGTAFPVVAVVPAAGSVALTNDKFAAALTKNTPVAGTVGVPTGNTTNYINVGYQAAAVAGAGTDVPAATQELSWKVTSRAAVANKNEVDATFYSNAQRTAALGSATAAAAFNTTGLNLKAGQINTIKLYAKFDATHATPANEKYFAADAFLPALLPDYAAANVCTLGTTNANALNNTKIIPSAVVTTSKVDSNDRRILTVEINLTIDATTCLDGEFTVLQLNNTAYRNANSFVRLNFGSTGADDISDRMTFVESGFSNEQDTYAWAYDEDINKTFMFDDNSYLNQVFFNNNVTSRDIKITYTLTNDDANSGLTIEGGVTNGLVSTKRETTFAGIKIKGKSKSTATLQVDGTADVAEYVTVNGVRSLQTYHYTFTKTVKIVANNLVSVGMNGGVYSEIKTWGREYDYAIGATAPLTAWVVNAPAVAGATTAKVEYRLNKTTYIEVDGSPAGFRDRWTVSDIDLAAAGFTWANTGNAKFALTQVAKDSVNDVTTELYVTVTYYDATNTAVSYASQMVKIVLKAKTDFEISLKNPAGEDYESTIVWDVDDVASATKDTREFYVRSNTVGYDLGAAGTDTIVYFSLKNGANSHWKVQQLDQIGDWNQVANGSTKSPYRLWFDGATDVTDTLTVTAIYGSGSGVKRAVATYELKSQVGSVTLDVQEYWAVGDKLDLRANVGVKYAGEAVSNEAPYVSWDVTDVANAEVGRLGDVVTIKKDGEKFKIVATYRKAGTNTTAVASKELTTVKKLTLSGVDADLNILVGESIDLTSALTATKATVVKSADSAIARVIGNTVTGMKAGSTTLRLEDGTHNYAVVNLTVGGVTPDPSEHYAGEPVTEDGVTGYLNEDLQTVTVTDATVVSKAITIPATVQGFPVVAIDPQAFKKTDAKIVYVVGSVEELGKGAFKASKVKKVYFYDPAALKTVGKNAFKKTNAKVVGVEAAFDESVAKDLKKAGAKSVKNNGTAK